MLSQQKWSDGRTNPPVGLRAKPRVGGSRCKGKSPKEEWVASGGGREKWLLICLRLVAGVHWQYWSAAADRLGALVILWSWEPNHVRDGHDLRVSHRKRSEDARGSDMGGIAGLFRP